jgi:hypothetical protein
VSTERSSGTVLTAEPSDGTNTQSTSSVFPPVSILTRSLRPHPQGFTSLPLPLSLTLIISLSRLFFGGRESSSRSPINRKIVGNVGETTTSTFSMMRVLPLLLVALALATTATTTSAAWDRDPATFCVGSPYGANFSNASTLPGITQESCGVKLMHYGSTHDMQQISEHCCKGSPGLNLDCVCGPGRVFNTSGLYGSSTSPGMMTQDTCAKKLLSHALADPVSGIPSSPTTRAPLRTCEAHRDAFNVSSDGGQSGENLAMVRAYCCSEPPPASVSCLCPGGVAQAELV